MVRRAIEIAQRLADAGYQPEAVVAEDVESIKRRFRTYLQKYVRGRRIDDWREQEQEREAVRELIPNLGTKNKRSIVTTRVDDAD